jgi:hypothetical protein
MWIFRQPKIARYLFSAFLIIWYLRYLGFLYSLPELLLFLPKKELSRIYLIIFSNTIHSKLVYIFA